MGHQNCLHQSQNQQYHQPISLRPLPCCWLLLLLIYAATFAVSAFAQSPTDFHPRRVYAYQREVKRGGGATATGNGGTLAERKEAAAEETAAAANEFLICDQGKPVKGVCVCESGYVGKHCERKMHCLREYGRAEDGSCLNCTDSFTGPDCDQPICQNGGVEQPNGQQLCQCEAPYSGPFCTELRMEDVYYFYNTKAAIIGPLGILLIVPMIACFLICEKHARRRQVGRIQRAWANEQSILDGKRIESLLKGKEPVR